MPVIGTVTALSRADLGTAGDYLEAVRAGGLELADLVVAPVGTGGEVAADAALDALRPPGAAEVVRAAQLTGKAGQVAHAVARVVPATARARRRSRPAAGPSRRSTRRSSSRRRWRSPGS